MRAPKDVKDMEDNSKIGMREAASAARNAAGESEELTVVTLRRGETMVETRVCTEENVMGMLGRFVEEVRDPASDMILACAYRTAKAGLTVSQECLGCAWKESDRSALGRFRKAMSGRNLAEIEDDAETAVVWVEREDGQVAKVLVPAADEDFWCCIDRAFPRSWELMDEGMAWPDGQDGRTMATWDASFGPGEDEELATWLAEAMTEYHGALDDQDATVDAVRSEGIAVVTWIADGREARQTIALNPGDFEKLAVGHDPVAEQWEDGCGNLVCIENAQVGTE